MSIKQLRAKQASSSKDMLSRMAVRRGRDRAASSSSGISHYSLMPQFRRPSRRQSGRRSPVEVAATSLFHSDIDAHPVS